MVSREIVKQLQETLLKAVLLGSPLPGRSQSMRFPDLEFVLKGETIALAETNLGGAVSVPGAPKPIRILTPAQLADETKTQGQIAFLQFGPAEMSGDAVRIALAARIASGDPSLRELGLSSLLVTFAKVGDDWQVLEEPITLAY